MHEYDYEQQDEKEEGQQFNADEYNQRKDRLLKEAYTRFHRSKQQEQNTNLVHPRFSFTNNNTLIQPRAPVTLQANLTTIDASALHNDVPPLSPSVVSHSRANSEVHGENEDSDLVIMMNC